MYNVDCGAWTCGNQIVGQARQVIELSNTSLVAVRHVKPRDAIYDKLVIETMAKRLFLAPLVHVSLGSGRTELVFFHSSYAFEFRSATLSFFFFFFTIFFVCGRPNRMLRYLFFFYFFPLVCLFLMR